MSKTIHLTRDDILIGDNSPVGKVTPEFVGQSYITTAGVLYVSTSLNNLGWKVVAGAHLNSPVYVGTEEPIDTNVVWIDPNDETGEEILADAILLEEIGNAIRKVTNQVKDIHYAFTDRLDSGLFKEDEEIPVQPRRINRIQIKRGNKVDLPDLADGEFGFCKDTKELWIGVDGKLTLIGKVGGGSGSTDNITADYIELLSPNKTAFRLTVTDNGELDVYDASIDTAPEPNVNEAGRFKGLIINQMYGGGAKNSNITPVSHGFIELYNNTENPINLKGLSLQYKEHAKGWQSLQLRGIVPAFTSFLIRGAQHSNPNIDTVRCKITEYDMSWDIPFTDKGFSAYLTIGRDTIGTENPFNSDGKGLKLAGYIDLLGCGGEDVTRVVDAYEKRFNHFMSSSKAIHRKDYADTDDNMLDTEVLDYSVCDVDIYRPRCVKDGKWDVYYDKIKLDPAEPNIINISYGKLGDSSRTFTWQTLPTTLGYLRYRKKGVAKTTWTQVPTTKRPVQNHDTDATVHNVIIRDLTPGIYEYQAGEEGKWTEIYEFKVKTYTEEDTMNFLHVSDQQGWNDYEYHAWKKAIEYIQENEEFDWILNTGDISQNGNRAFEWRYYYHYAKDLLRTTPHMSCLGNNDMIKTVKPPDSTPFTYYTNFEDSPYVSCHSFDLGDVHFVCLNSEEMYEEQIEWLKQDLTATTKRWVIAYMHVSPYTVIQTPKAQVFREVFEEYGVHLVLCGHNHCYSRSQPMYKEQIDPDKGVYYVMSQATGFKLSGKEAPNLVDPPEYYGHVETPGQPSYIMWSVSKDKIVMKSYRINNIKPTELDNGVIEKYLFDSIEIPYRDRRNLNVIKNV